jgi:hypothetical protein
MFRDRPDGSMDSGPQLRQWILVLAKFLMAPNVDTFLPGEDDHLAAHLGSGFRRGHGIGAGRRKMKALEGETGRDGTATVVSLARGSVGMGHGSSAIMARPPTCGPGPTCPRLCATQRIPTCWYVLLGRL